MMMRDWHILWQPIRRRLVIVIALLLLVFLVAALALIHGYTSRKLIAASATPAFSYTCSGGPESLLCLDKQYQLKAEQRGVAAAFVALKVAYRADPNVRADCHQLTHVIGRVAADHAASIEDAYGQGDNFCWSGYYHGVMEAFISKVGPKNLDSAIPTICAHIAATKPYSFYHFNCVHGLGHGIMDVTRDNLFTSLATCNLLHDTWEQESCYGGVFMENEMDEINPGHGTPYFKADEPMYPCTAVDNRYKEQCYLMQTSHALRVAHENFSTVFAECSAVDAQYVDTCYQSLGRDASGNSSSAVGLTESSCMFGQTLDAQENCIVGAVKDFISYYHSDTQAEVLCQALGGSLQPTCETTKTQYYSTF